MVRPIALWPNAGESKPNPVDAIQVHLTESFARLRRRLAPEELAEQVVRLTVSVGHIHYLDVTDLRVLRPHATTDRGGQPVCGRGTGVLVGRHDEETQAVRLPLAPVQHALFFPSLLTQGLILPLARRREERNLDDLSILNSVKHDAPPLVRIGVMMLSTNTC